MVVVLVDEEDIELCPPEAADRRKPAEASADDEDPWSAG